jgi:CheY-like chemotaxis protein
VDSQTNYPDNLSDLESTQDGDTWQQNDASAETEAKPERQRERKVLLVDPNSRDLELMKKAILSQSPLYDVLACLNAADALNLAQAGSIDVIVTNNELPGESFDEFLSSLMRLLPYSPIIVTTAKDSPELALKLLLAGVSDYLPKFGEFQRFLPRTITTNLQRAIIIENLKEMYDKVEQSSRDEALLNRFIVNIHGSLDLADIVDRATQSLLEEFNAPEL